MLYAIVGVVVLLADQFIKYWTIAHLELNTGIQSLIPGVIHLTYIRNYGAVFGLLQDMKATRWIFLVLLVLFTAGMLFLLLKGILRSPLSRWSGALLLAGALGNGLDRAIYGYVVDMFEFEFVKFAIFNLADCLMLVCGILFCISIIFGRKSRGRDLDAELEEAGEAPRGGSARRGRLAEPEDEEEAPVRPRRRAAAEAFEDEPAPVRARRPAPSAAQPARRAAADTFEDEPAPVRVKRPAPAAAPAQQPVRRPAAPAAEPYAETPVRPRRAAAETYEDEPAPVRVKRPAPAAAAPAQPVRRPAAPAADAAETAQTPAAPAAKKASDDFDLDSILAEFK